MVYDSAEIETRWQARWRDARGATIRFRNSGRRSSIGLFFVGIGRAMGVVPATPEPHTPVLASGVRAVFNNS